MVVAVVEVDSEVVEVVTVAAAASVVMMVCAVMIVEDEVDRKVAEWEVAVEAVAEGVEFLRGTEIGRVTDATTRTLLGGMSAIGVRRLSLMMDPVRAEEGAVLEVVIVVVVAVMEAVVIVGVVETSVVVAVAEDLVVVDVEEAAEVVVSTEEIRDPHVLGKNY